MVNFVSFACMGGMLMMAILMWRLYVALDTQHQLETSLISASEDLEAERLSAAALVRSQSETVELLTHENQSLQTQATQNIAAFTQLKSDHQALQDKYSELERDLLGNLAQCKSLEETLQTYKLEQAALQRQNVVLKKDQTQREQEQQTLRTEHQKITGRHQKYQQVIQAAKAKISTLEKEKKQLERDLQQALYQVVALEQEQKLAASLMTPAQFSNQSSAIPESYTVEPSLPSF